MVRLFFIISMITLPFSDFAGLHFLGEMQHDLSGHFMMLTLGLGFIAYASNAVLSRNHGPRRPGSFIFSDAAMLTRIMALFLAVIAASLAMNMSTILSTAANDRNGVGKFIVATLMIVCGFGFAYLAFYLARANSLQKLVIQPIAISVVICAIFAALEGLSFAVGGPFKQWQSAISELTHSGSRGQLGAGGFYGGVFGWYDDAAGKTRSVSFEAPAFADFLGMAWPWLYVGTMIYRGGKKLAYIGLTLLAIILMYFSGARTGYLFIAGNVAVLLLLRYVYLPTGQKALFPPVPMTFLLRTAAVLAVVAYVAAYSHIVARVVEADIHRNGEAVSNVSRLAMMTAGFSMLHDYPLLGMGFGQFGFHVLRFIPNWGWRSWEITQWFSGNAKVWPSAFSIYARFGAELGLVGIVVWCGLWIYLARSVYRATLSYQRVTGKSLFGAYPLIMGCYCVLIHGLASDALHSPLIWVTLGLCCYYIEEIRQALQPMPVYHAPPMLSDNA